jgi:hypothetical protein
LRLEENKMTNVSATPEKVSMRDRLFQIGIETLRQEGWKIERIPGIGKSSVRRITKGGKSRKVSIRTSQDRWIAFPRNQTDNGWITLSDVDVVLAVSVDDSDDPKFAQVHMIEGNEMRQRFDRAYKARKAAGRSIPLGRGVWVPLYHPDRTDPVTDVGGGAGLEHPPIARVPLGPSLPDSDVFAETEEADSRDKPLTIAEAKRRLAMTFGVEPSSIKITVEA